MNPEPRNKTDFVAKAQETWGNPPDWILVLAEACNRSTQTAVAKRIDYSSSAVSAVLSNTYRNGDLRRFEGVVRGALMAETVICPMLGDLPLNVCLGWQKKPFDPTNSHRVRMHQACRGGCEHSRIPPSQGDD